MSKMRPSLREGPGVAASPPVSTQWWMIHQSVEAAPRLIHGALERNGEFCAIGATFDQYSTPLHTSIVDEVAAYNDSMPKANKVERRRRMLKWLQFKIDQYKAK